MKGFLYVLLLLALFNPAFSHLEVGSLLPKGGETFYVGDAMTIEWNTLQAHDGRYDIYFSKNGGETYPLEMAGPWQGSRTDGEKNTYLWEIPEDAVTTQGRIRICQLAGGHCKDPGVYMMDSPENFSIEEEPASIGRNIKSAINPYNFSITSLENRLDVHFNLAEGNSVSLKAYDLSGKLLSTLIEKNLAGGNYEFSYDRGLSGNSSAVVFKLEVNGLFAASKIWMAP